MVDEGAILVGGGDHVFGWDIDFVTSGHHHGPSVIGPQVGQISQSLDEIAVEEAVLSVGAEGDVGSAVETIGRRLFEVLIGFTAVDVGVHFDNTGLPADQFFGHRDQAGVGGVSSDGRIDLDNMGDEVVMGFALKEIGSAHPRPRRRWVLQLSEFTAQLVEHLLESSHLGSR